MVHTATTKYASHIDTRVYLYLGDDEWEIDVEEIELDLTTGEMQGIAFDYDNTQKTAWIGDIVCRKALAKFEEENEQ